MQQNNESEPTVAVIEKTEEKPKILPPYHVILLNDDDHTAIYVINLCRSIFGYPMEKGVEIAIKVHVNKKCIVWTGQKEVAELRRDQIHAFGKDVLVANCKGSMSAVIEPAT